MSEVWNFSTPQWPSALSEATLSDYSKTTTPYSLMIKIVTRILLYVSLGFFGWYLYRLDYLVFDELSFNLFFLGLSFVFLFSGFVLSTVSWGYALKVHRFRSDFKKSLVSHGISVFAKYIPGKIWVILGRASLVSDDILPLKTASLISLKEQLIYLFWGLMISCLPVFFFVGNIIFGSLILLSAAAIGFVIFSPWFHKGMLKLAGKILRKELDIPLIKLGDALKISRVVVLYWFCWIFAFYFLIISIFPHTSFLMAFAFPVSVTYGVLAIFMPGGIGVREGILTAFLTAGGMSLENAITLSVISRLWFIAGEVFLFLLATAFKFSGKGVGYPVYPSTSQKAEPENR